MSRGRLIHWNASGIEERAARLERAGYEVSGSTVETAGVLCQAPVGTPGGSSH